MKNFIGNKTNQKITIVIFAGLCLLITGAYFLREDLPKTKPEFVTLTGLPPKTTVEALIETPGRHADILTFANNGLTLPKIIQSPNTPYRISTSLKMPWGNYTDLTLTIGKDKKNLTILADGFSSYDEITMTLNNRPVYKNVPMDWSGRIELKSDLPLAKSVNACIQINGQLQSIGLCHVIEAGNAV